MTDSPSDHLQSLSAQLLSAVQAGATGLLASSSQLLAVATAFVTLGLLDDHSAEAALQAHRGLLEGLGRELRGVSTGELTLTPTSAREFAAASSRDRATLEELPIATALPRARLALGTADLVLGCVVRTRRGLRGHAWIESASTDLPPWPQRVGGLSVTTTAGDTHLVTLHPDGQVAARANPPFVQVTLRMEPSLAEGERELVLESHGGSVALSLEPLSSPPSGRGAAAPSGPGETYLARLAAGLPLPDSGETVGVGLTAAEAHEVVRCVGDALVAVGAIAEGNAIRSDRSRIARPDWRAGVLRQFTSGLHAELIAPNPAAQYVARGAPIPLERSSAVLSWMVLHERAAYFELYFSPDVRGEYWPVAVRNFDVTGHDNLGNAYLATSVSHWQGYRGEGWGDMVLWPLIAPDAQRLRFEVATLWERAWIDIDLTP